MNKKKAIENIRKYDHEFPNTYIDDVLTYLDLDRRILNDIIDKHRNEEIWIKQNDKWNLSNKL